MLRNLSRMAPRAFSARMSGLATAGFRHVVPPMSTFTSRAVLLGSLEDSKFNLKQPKKGTGFDYFTPRGEKKKPDKKQADTDKKESSSDKGGDDSKNFSKQDDNKNRNDNGRRDFNDPNRFENWIPAIVMLLITYYLTQRPGADEPAEGRSLDREISWHDFLRLLQQQDVVKIVVTDDRQSARVYLKPNAKGLGRTAGGGFAAAAATSSSYEEQRRQRAAANHNHRDEHDQLQQQQQKQHDEFHEQEQEQMEGLQASATSVASGVPNLVGQRHTPFFYRMHIGSVESFERKLDEAQRALKRDPDNDVPVQYLPDSVSTCML